MGPISLGSRSIGPGQPCFIIAEASINHNGDMALAHRIIDAAVEAGADAVKFQNYRTEDFILDRSITYEYVSQGKRIVENQYDMFKRGELSRQRLRELKEHCDRLGVVFLSTPTSEEGIEDLVNIGTLMLKNGSDYLGHLPLIQAMARTGLPTMLSTGMATRSEIEDAVSAYRGAGGAGLILLHCVSSYPTPAEEVHLKKIPAIAEAFKCPVGFSDHSWGVLAAIASVALGACVIEKHFTLDKNMAGPDHRFSADPAELRALVEGVRVLEKNLGSAAIQPIAAEMTGRRDYRLSCVAAKNLSKGVSLSKSDIVFRRPGTGLPPKALSSLLGKKLSRNIKQGAAFSAEDIDERS